MTTTLHNTRNIFLLWFIKDNKQYKSWLSILMRWMSWLFYHQLCQPIKLLVVWRKKNTNNIKFTFNWLTQLIKVDSSSALERKVLCDFINWTWSKFVFWATQEFRLQQQQLPCQKWPCKEGGLGERPDIILTCRLWKGWALTHCLVCESALLSSLEYITFILSPSQR